MFQRLEKWWFIFNLAPDSEFDDDRNTILSLQQIRSIQAKYLKVFGDYQVFEWGAKREGGEDTRGD